MESTILIVDDEKEMCVSLSEFFTSKGYNTLYTVDPLKVDDLINKSKIDLIIMDVKMPQLGGIELLKIIKKKNRFIPIIMVTGYPSIKNAVQAMKYGAINFYVKPLKIWELVEEINQILAMQRNKRKTYAGEYEILTENKTMLKILKNLRKVAQTDAAVLITGESGTGKELAARYIHHLSARREAHIIAILCSGIDKNSNAAV